MQLFNCQSVKDVADKRRQNFVKKYCVSRNGLCKLLCLMFIPLMLCDQLECVVEKL